ncbi:hypothetical protein K8R47_03565 [archaeon]|nr:hypothetical protein [archaeon]
MIISIDLGKLAGGKEYLETSDNYDESQIPFNIKDLIFLGEGGFSVKSRIVGSKFENKLGHTFYGSVISKLYPSREDYALEKIDPSFVGVFNYLLHQFIPEEVRYSRGFRINMELDMSNQKDYGRVAHIVNRLEKVYQVIVPFRLGFPGIDVPPNSFHE